MNPTVHYTCSVMQPTFGPSCNGKSDVITTNGHAKYMDFSCNTNYTMIEIDLATCVWSSTIQCACV